MTARLAANPYLYNSGELVCYVMREPEQWIWWEKMLDSTISQKNQPNFGLVLVGALSNSALVAS